MVLLSALALLVPQFDARDDYKAAAALLKKTSGNGYFQDGGGTYLAKMTALHRDNPRVFALVESGNLKPYSPSPKSLDFSTVADNKQIAKYLAGRAYALDAEGNSKAATDTLLVAQTYSQRVSEGSIINQLVAAACQAIVNAGFNERLHRMSYVDLQRTERATRSLLSHPTDMAAIFWSEYENFAVIGAEEMKRDPNPRQSITSLVMAGEDDSESPEDKRMREAIAAIPQSELAKIPDLVVSITKENARRAGEILKGPEKNWFNRLEELAESNSSEIKKGATAYEVARAVAAMATMNYSGAANAELRSRTQIRLLVFHCAVLERKWETRKLPKTLEEAVSAPDTVDPISGEKFVYEPHPDGTYELYSKGNQSLGRIDLKYVPRLGAPADNTKPTPR